MSDSFIAHRSSFNAHRSPLIAQRSTLIAHRSPLTVHRSTPTVKHFYFFPSNRTWCQNEQKSLKIVQKQT
jgi:hypothetical protein